MLNIYIMIVGLGLLSVLCTLYLAF